MKQETRNFYHQMLAIALPITFQSLIVSSLNTLDTVMISTLGSETIAGVGLANQVFFLFMLICFGIGTGASVMIAQYHGRRDWHRVRKTNALATLLALGVGLVFTLIGIFLPKTIIQLLIQDSLVIEEGAKYLTVVAFSYLVTGVSFVNGISLRSTGNPKAPLVASIISFLFNAFFNYVLIFGQFGFPQLGVVGAAIGTIIARIVELLVIVYVARQADGPLHGPIRQLFQIPYAFFANFFSVASPVILNETMWAIGQILYSVAYAIVGTKETAAIQVVVAIQNIAFVLIRGLSNASSIMIGNEIGRGHMDKSQVYAYRFLKLGLVIGILIGIFLVITPEFTLSLFNRLDPSVKALSISLLKVMGILFIIKAFNSILIVGILRGGGDTKYSLLLEMACIWLVGVPLAFIGASLLHLSIEWVVTLAAMEEVAKIIFGMRRVYSQKWIHEIQ